MKKLLPPLFLTLIYSFSFSQNFSQSKIQVDSLISLLPSLPDDTNKVWIYEKIASFYVFNNRTIGQKYVNLGLELTRKVEFKRGESWLLLRLGQIYQLKSDFVNGYKYFSEALKLSEEMKYPKEKRRIMGQLTGIYRSLGDYEKTLETHREVLKLSKELHYEIDNAYRGMGETYLKINMLDSALHLTLQGYEVAKKENSDFHDDLLQLGNIYVKLKNYKQAMFCFQEVIKLALKKQNETILYKAHEGLSEYYLQLGKMDSCIYYKQKVLFAAQKGRYIKGINEHSRFLATYFDTINPPIALKYYRLEASTRDSVDNQLRFIELQKIIFREQQIQQEKLILEEKKKNNLRLTILILGFAFIGTIVVILYIINKKNQKILVAREKESELKKQNAELQAALLQGQATERKRLADDLHDNLGSTMSALRWSMEAINPQKLSPQEQEVYRHVQNTIAQAHDQVRLLSHNLLPEELEKQGLWEALRQLISKLNRNTPVKWVLTLPHHPPRFDAKMEFELYSIVLELTNNTLKHAQATEGNVMCQRIYDQWHITVSDNGVGLAEKRTYGKGMNSVESRVKSLNGQLHIHTQTGEGTRFEVILSDTLLV